MTVKLIFHLCRTHIDSSKESRFVQEFYPFFDFFFVGWGNGKFVTANGQSGSVDAAVECFLRQVYDGLVIDTTKVMWQNTLQVRQGGTQKILLSLSSSEYHIIRAEGFYSCTFFL